MANAIDREDVHPLIPTNPHKLFRRELLMEHGIRFPEGGRVLWEDVFFALDLAPHLEVVSVLADTPFYHWYCCTSPPPDHRWPAWSPTPLQDSAHSPYAADRQTFCPAQPQQPGTWGTRAALPKRHRASCHAIDAESELTAH
jgi:hypothetical protein